MSQFSKLIKGQVECEKCDANHFNELTGCKDDCDIITDNGCDSHQKCIQGPDKAFCDAIITEPETTTESIATTTPITTTTTTTTSTTTTTTTSTTTTTTTTATTTTTTTTTTRTTTRATTTTHLSECDIVTGDGCNSYQKCIQGPDKAFCECQLPLSEDDGTCQPKECTDSSCNGNGKCVQLPGSKQKVCLCKITHAGLFCEKPRGCPRTETEVLANQDPCLNGGICVSESQSGHPYKCDCEEGFYGEFCEKISPCHRLKAKVR